MRRAMIENTILASALILLTMCGRQPVEPEDGARVMINNDEDFLNRRVRYTDEEIALESQNSLQKKATVADIRLRLLAEIDTPTIDGRRLYANHVTLKDGFAYVSYSTPNDDFRGGVEIFDTRVGRRPIIRSLALFSDTDVSIAVEKNGKLFLGEATDSDHHSNFTTPAALEIITLDNHRLTPNSRRIDLPSFNGNDIAFFNNTLLVTSGTTDGALSIFDEQTLNLLRQIDIDAAKAVATHREFIVIMEGTGSRLHLYDRNFRDGDGLQDIVELGCPNFFTAKAEIQVVNDRVYLSAWDCGMIVVDLLQRRIKNTIPAPNGANCNAISVEREFLCMANGSAGLLIARITDQGLQPLGSARFAGSTNYVTADGNWIFVANGIGGLKVLEIVR